MWRNVTLDVVCYNFGIQEYSPFNDATQEVFHGCPVMKDGYLYANEAPAGASRWTRRRRRNIRSGTANTASARR